MASGACLHFNIWKRVTDQLHCKRAKILQVTHVAPSQAFRPSLLHHLPLRTLLGCSSNSNPAIMPQPGWEFYSIHLEIWH